MIRVDFYHLKKHSLDEALPKLLEKAYSLKKNIKLLLKNEDSVEYFNNFLWTYNEEKFLPHGIKKDGFSEMQPIFISSEYNNPNQAKILFITDDAEINIENLSEFERIIYIFDGNSEISLNKARILWKALKNSDFEINYWQEADNGSWSLHSS